MKIQVGKSYKDSFGNIHKIHGYSSVTNLYSTLEGCEFDESGYSYNYYGYDGNLIEEIEEETLPKVYTRDEVIDLLDLYNSNIPLRGQLWLDKLEGLSKYETII